MDWEANLVAHFNLDPIDFETFDPSTISDAAKIADGTELALPKDGAFEGGEQVVNNLTILRDLIPPQTVMQRRMPYLEAKRELQVIERRVADSVGRYEEASQNVLLNLVEVDAGSAVPIVYRNHSEMMSANKVRIDTFLHKQDANRRLQQTELHDATRTLNKIHGILDRELNAKPSSANNVKSARDAAEATLVEDAILHADQVLRLDFRTHEAGQERTEKKLNEALQRIQKNMGAVTKVREKLAGYERYASNEQQLRFLEKQANEQYKEILRLRSACETSEAQLRQREDGERKLQEQLEEREEDCEKAHKALTTLQIELDIKKRELQMVKTIGCRPSESGPANAAAPEPSSPGAAAQPNPAKPDAPAEHHEIPARRRARSSKVTNDGPALKALRKRVKELETLVQDLRDKAAAATAAAPEKASEPAVARPADAAERPDSSSAAAPAELAPETSEAVAVAAPEANKTERKALPAANAPESSEMGATPEQIKAITEKYERRIAALQREVRAREQAFETSQRLLETTKSKHLEIVEVSASLLEREHSLETQVHDLKQKLKKAATDGAVGAAASMMAANKKLASDNQLIISLRKEIEDIQKQKEAERIGFDSRLAAALRDQREKLTSSMRQSLCVLQDEFPGAQLDLAEAGAQEQQEQDNTESDGTKEDSSEGGRASNDEANSAVQPVEEPDAEPAGADEGPEPSPKTALVVNIPGPQMVETGDQIKALRSALDAANAEILSLKEKLEQQVKPASAEPQGTAADVGPGDSAATAAPAADGDEAGVTAVEGDEAKAHAASDAADSSLTSAIESELAQIRLELAEAHEVCAMSQEDRLGAQVMHAAHLATTKAELQRVAHELGEKAGEVESAKEAASAAAEAAKQAALELAGCQSRLARAEEYNAALLANDGEEGPDNAGAQSGGEAAIESPAAEHEASVGAARPKSAEPACSPAIAAAAEQRPQTTSGARARHAQKPARAGLRTLVSQLQERLNAAEMELVVRRQAAEALQIDLERAVSETAVVGSQLQDSNAAREALEQTVKDLEAKLDAAEAALERRANEGATAVDAECQALRAEKTILEDALAQAKQEMAATKSRLVAVVQERHQEASNMQTLIDQQRIEWEERLLQERANWEEDTELGRIEIEAEMAKLQKVVEEKERQAQDLRSVNAELIYLQRVSEFEKEQARRKAAASAESASKAGAAGADRKDGRGKSGRRSISSAKEGANANVVPLGGRQGALVSELKLAHFKLTKLREELNEVKAANKELEAELHRIEIASSSSSESNSEELEELDEADKAAEAEKASELAIADGGGGASSMEEPSPGEGEQVPSDANTEADDSEAAKNLPVEKPEAPQASSLRRVTTRAGARRSEVGSTARVNNAVEQATAALRKRVAQLEHALLEVGNGSASMASSRTAQQHPKRQVMDLRSDVASQVGSFAVKKYFAPEKPIAEDKEEPRLRKAFSVYCKLARDTVMVQAVKAWGHFTNQVIIMKRLRIAEKQKSTKVCSLLRAWLGRHGAAHCMQVDLFRERLHKLERGISRAAVIARQQQREEHARKTQGKAIPIRKEVDPRQVLFHHMFGGEAGQHVLPMRVDFDGVVDKRLQYHLTPTQLERIMVVTTFIPPEFGVLPVNVKHQIVADVVEFVLRTKAAAKRGAEPTPRPAAGLARARTPTSPTAHVATSGFSRNTRARAPQRPTSRAPAGRQQRPVKEPDSAFHIPQGTPRHFDMRFERD